jgi:peroxiredoxin
MKLLMKLVVGTAISWSVLAVAGCEDSAKKDTPPAASATQNAVASAAPSASASVAPPVKKIPRQRETTATSDKELGSLPKGVGLAVGKKALDAEVENYEGKKVKLFDILGKEPVLLVFYRGGWCPYCNYQVHEFAKAYPEYKKRGVMPVVISVDRPEESSKTQAQYKIPFPVLSDPDLKAHKAYQVLQVVDEKTREKYTKFGIDLEKASGKNHHTIAVPSIFLISKDRKVLWAHADREYKTRPHTEQLMKVLDKNGFKAK